MWPIWMRSTPLFVASIVISLSTVNWMAVYILCCFWCKNYRKTLRTLVSRSDKQSEKDSKYPTPFRYLNSPEKAIRYQRGHELRRSCQRKLALDPVNYCTRHCMMTSFSKMPKQSATLTHLEHLHEYFGRVRRKLLH